MRRLLLLIVQPSAVEIVAEYLLRLYIQTIQRDIDLPTAEAASHRLSSPYWRS